MSSTRTVPVTDHSIASMTGSAQALVGQDGRRSLLHIFNNGADNLTITFQAWNESGTVGDAGGAAGGGIVIVPDGSLTFNTASIPGNAVQVTGTSGQPVTCYTSP